MSVLQGRGLSSEFMNDLQNGLLAPILALVKADHSLTLCIRNGYINIYYRGGSILKISEFGNRSYKFEFDRNYRNSSGSQLTGLPTPDYNALPTTVDDPSKAATWLSNVPLLKCAMDLWFGQHPKSEREFQQLVERSNNSDYRTDYFVCDLEYTHPDCKELRADMIALHWPSTHAARKNRECIALAIVEMKHRDGALNSATQSAGLIGHVKKTVRAVQQGGVSLANLAEEMRVVFNQRLELGLIECHSQRGKIARNIDCIDYGNPEFIVLLSDHDPESGTLETELRSLQGFIDRPGFPFEVKIATASCMGYGLFEDYVLPLSVFCERLQGKGRIKVEQSIGAVK